MSLVIKIINIRIIIIVAKFDFIPFIIVAMFATTVGYFWNKKKKKRKEEIQTEKDVHNKIVKKKFN